jgi:hypothetical protein
MASGCVDMNMMVTHKDIQIPLDVRAVESDGLRTMELFHGARMLTLIQLQIEVGHGKKAIAIFVPVPSLQGFHRVQQR